MQRSQGKGGQCKERQDDEEAEREGEVRVSAAAGLRTTFSAA